MSRMSNRLRRRAFRRMRRQSDSDGTVGSCAVQTTNMEGWGQLVSSAGLQTSAVKYVPTASSFLRALNEGETNMIHAQIQCITAMEFYKDCSLEELRLNGYLANSILVSPSDETKQHFTLESCKPYVAVIDLTPSCEDDSSVDCISWPVQSSEPNSTPVKFHTESSHHSADLEQDSVPQSYSSSPATDKPVEVSVQLSCASSVPVQNPGDEITFVSHSSSATCQKLTNILTSFDKSDVDNVTAQTSDISLNSNASVTALDNDKLTNFTECLTSISSISHTAGNDTHIASTSGIYQHASPSDNSIREKHGNGLAAAGSLLIERNNQNINQNNDAKDPAENGQPQEQCGVESSKDNSDALSDEISCMTELQKSLSAKIGQTCNKELLGWVIVNELQASRDIPLHQKLPLNLLRAAVKHRDMLTRQLMDLFEVVAIYSQLHCLIEVALVEEFGFICHLKRIMIAKSIEGKDNETSETRVRHDVRTDYPNAVFSPGSSVRDFKQRHRVQTVPEEKTKDDVCKHVSDLYAQSLLSHETDVLMFSEPGKLFRFEVLPGSRFVESWRRRGSGVVSLFQDKTAELVKIVVSHWSSKEDFSLILIRSSMKTKTAMSKNGLQLKFMGLEVSKCRERMRYFMIQFESSRVTKAFNQQLHSLTFLNISDHSPDSGSTCCLDVVFKSHRIHEEFPSMMGDDETDRRTYDDDVTAKDESNRDGFHDVGEFKWCSDGKTAPDESPGTADGAEFCIAEDLQTRRNSFPIFSRALDLAKMPAIENQELGKIGQRCGQEITKTRNCTKLLKAWSEKCLFDVKQTETNNDCITGIERKTEIVKDVVENDCGETIRGSSTENYSGSLSDAENSCSTNLFAYAASPSFCVYRNSSGDIGEDLDETDIAQDRLKFIPDGGSHLSPDQDDCGETIRGSSMENYSGSLSDAENSCSTNLFAYAASPSFCIYRNSSGDIGEDLDETDIAQDRLKFIPDGGSHLSPDQDGGLAQNAYRGNCDFKLSLGSKYQFPSVDDHELAGLKGETLLLNHAKIDDKDSNNVTTENQCRLSPTVVVHPLGTCHDNPFSKVYYFKIPDSISVPTGGGLEEETSNIDSRNCDRAVKIDVSENRCAVSHANEFSSTILISKSEEDGIVNNEKKLGIEESEVMQKQKQPLSDKAVADFLTCTGVLCEKAGHLTRLLETVDANNVDISLEKKVTQEVLTEKL